MLTRSSVLYTVSVGWTCVSLVYFISQAYIVMGLVSCFSYLLSVEWNTHQIRTIFILTDLKDGVNPHDHVAIGHLEERWRTIV